MLNQFFLSNHTRIDHNYFVKSIALYFIKELIRVQVARPLILSLIRPNQSEQNLTPEFNLTHFSYVLTSRSKTLLRFLTLLISHTCYPVGAKPFSGDKHYFSLIRLYQSKQNLTVELNHSSLIRPNQSEQNLTPELNFTSFYPS